MKASVPGYEDGDAGSVKPTDEAKGDQKTAGKSDSYKLGPDCGCCSGSEFRTRL